MTETDLDIHREVGGGHVGLHVVRNQVVMCKSTKWGSEESPGVFCFDTASSVVFRAASGKIDRKVTADMLTVGG